MLRSSYRFCAVFVVAAFAAACGDDGTTSDSNGALEVESQPLSSFEDLFDGVPANESLPEDGKFDARYPATFDTMATQSPVRSQGSRGTCSIFATVALMEQAYRVEGTIAAPDFSEQFLQWSVKTEVRAFTNTEGSNPSRNLEAVHRFGIVTEADAPYETQPWGASNDVRCVGEDRPVVCYTNGEPSETARNARRWTLPPGRYVNCSNRSIKAYITENNIGVSTSVEFFYQSWNHGGSSLPVNTANYAEGFVMAPNEADITDSRLRPAGHAVHLVGWDDTRSVQRVDGEGRPVVDAQGNPVMETGFFLFKNSWGVGRFGSRNPFGVGYGWISYDYVSRFGSCFSTTVPRVELGDEVCDNGVDDNLDGAIDCDDADCADDRACLPGGLRFDGPGGAIPDNNTTGLSSTVQVDADGTVESLDVTVDITHTYRGDLEVTLRAPDGRVEVLHARTGGSADDLRETFAVSALAGSPARGDWTLTVRDLAGSDVGSLNRWTLDLRLGGDAPAEVCDDGIDNNTNGLTDCADEGCLEDAACATVETLRIEGEGGLAIPDNSEAGISSIAEVTASGVVDSIRVNVDITHPYRGDLVVTLENESGTVVTLFSREGAGEDNLVRTFAPTEFVGQPANGLWLLNVSDRGNLDVGTLTSWSLELVVRPN